MRIEYFFAAGYLACALIAFAAWRSRPEPAFAAVAPFWLRIAVGCCAFAILRLFDAQIAMSSAVRNLGHSWGLLDWKRPGPYIMLVVLVLCSLALAGLLFFRPRATPRSVNLAAWSAAILVLLAAAHSLSLNLTSVWLQMPTGPTTLSRVMEAGSLLLLALSGMHFLVSAKALPIARPLR